MIKNNSV